MKKSSPTKKKVAKKPATTKKPATVKGLPKGFVPFKKGTKVAK